MKFQNDFIFFCCLWLMLFLLINKFQYTIFVSMVFTERLSYVQNKRYDIDVFFFYIDVCYISLLMKHIVE